MADKLEKLGKYTLDKRIAAGGMAEVFLSTDETGRRCVIKRMLPNLLIDKQFAQMFLDEAKLVVQLNHPAIAQIYDFGQDKGVLYLAMEWVDGTNLRLIVKDFARRGGKIPVEYCARLVSQACLALGYAHRAAGLDGKLLKIIHRDVSPQNILLGQNGEVKLIDFGVAKATSASQQTAAGMIKGKFAYMSPEQLRGNPLDGRSDIYGLGLVLYELLAAERAIPGASEAEIAQNALQMAFAPIEKKRPDVPAPLKAILARALSRDRDKRYDTAEDMAAELETFITPRMPKLSGAELAKILPATPEAPREKDSGSKPIASAAPKRPVIAAAPRDAVPSEQFWAPVPYEAVARTVINPPGLVPRPVAAGGRQPLPAPTGVSRGDLLVVPPRSKLRWFLGATVLGFAAAGVGWQLLQKPAPARLTLTSSIPARVSIDGNAALKTPAELSLQAGSHQLVFEDPASSARQSKTITLSAGETHTEAWTPLRGRVVIRAEPWAEVFLAGKSLGTTPLEPISLLSGKHTFTFVNSQTQRQDERLVEVKPGADTAITVDLQPVP